MNSPKRSGWIFSRRSSHASERHTRSRDLSVEMGLRDVSHGYRRGKPLVFDGLSLGFDDRCTVIVGPNGAGKSTLLKLLAGQIRPGAGSVRVPQQLGYCPQRPVKLSAFTVAEQVEYVGWLGGMSRRAVPQAARQALDRVGLGDLAKRSTSALSGGQAQRLGIACALVNQPPMLLLDEPSAALDPIARSSVTDVLCDLAQDRVTVVASSHTAADIGVPFTRLVLMSQGQVTYDGSPSDFLTAEHADPLASEFARSLRVR